MGDSSYGFVSIAVKGDVLLTILCCPSLLGDFGDDTGWLVKEFGGGWFAFGVPVPDCWLNTVKVCCCCPDACIAMGRYRSISASRRASSSCGSHIHIHTYMPVSFLQDAFGHNERGIIVFVRMRTLLKT
jgi:hypothetical protein